MNSQGIEEIRRDEASADDTVIVGCAAGKDAIERLRAARDDYRSDRARVSAQQVVRRVRQRLRIGNGRILNDAYHRRGIAHRQRLEHDRIIERKCRDIDAHAQRDRENGHERESGAAPELPGDVAQVLACPVEPVPSPRLACRVRQARRVAEPSPCGGVSVGGRHPIRRELLGAEGKVEVHLLAQLPLESALVERIGDSEPQCTPCHGVGLSAASVTPAPG